MVTAFYRSDGHIAVHHLLADGDVAPTIVLENDRLPFDAHRSISLGRDAAGHLHLAYGAHSDSLRVVRARRPDSRYGFGRVCELEAEGGLTYPMFLGTDPTDGALQLLVRAGRWLAGDILLFRTRPDGTNWRTRTQTLVAGRTAGTWSVGPYLHRPVKGPDGRWHLFLAWRLPAQATSGNPAVNVGFDLACFRNGFRQLETEDGVALRLPVTPAVVGRTVAVGPGRSLMNQGGASVRPDGSPMACALWADADGIPQIHLVFREAGVWIARCISAFRTRYALEAGGTLALPHSRPALLVAPNGDALVIFRSREFGNRLLLLRLRPPDFILDAGEWWILVDEDLGFYEPVVSLSTRTAGLGIVAYVQACAQFSSSDTEPMEGSAPARLLRWPMQLISAPA